jgi:DNA-binding MarR family transcriptional regulator
MKPDTAQVQFIVQISQLNAKLLKKTEGQLSVHGISFTEFTILRFLHSAPKMTMRRIDLAESTNLSASGVTRLLAPMEKIKLVEKEVNPRDARVSLVKLSKTGERVYQEASLSFEHAAEFVTQRLSSNQLGTISELANKLF